MTTTTPSGTTETHIATDSFTGEGRDPFCLTRDEARACLRGAPWRRVLVMGDSVAAGIGDPVEGYRDLSWAERLVEAIAFDGDGNPVVGYRNLGRRGLRAGEIRARQLDEALAFAPDLVALSAGGNDMLDGSFDARRARTEIDNIVLALRGTGADVVMFSLLDLSKAPFVPDELRSWLHDGLHELSTVTEQVAARRGCVHVDFFHHPLSGDPSIYSADRLHVNRRGHAVVAAEILRALQGRLSDETT